MSRSPSQPPGKPPDYGSYQFSRRELIENILMFTALDATIAYLFYRSVIAFLILFPILIPFLRSRRKDLNTRRRREILAEFTTGMQMVNASLQAGYAIENSFREAISELRKIYPDDAFIIIEFRTFSHRQVSTYRSRRFFLIWGIALISKIFEILQRSFKLRSAPAVI
jgi:tight adherence protein B